MTTENRRISSQANLTSLSVSQNFSMPVISSSLLLGAKPGSMALDTLGNLQVRGVNNNVITLTSIVAGTGLTYNAGTISLVTPVAVANGGTGSSAALAGNRIMVSTSTTIIEAPALANGQLLIGSTGAPTPAHLTAGTGISIANGAGSITIGNSATVVGTTDQITATTTGNTTTIAFPRDVIFPWFISTERLYSVGKKTRFTSTTNFTDGRSFLRTSSGFINGTAPAAGNFEIVIDVDQGIIPSLTQNTKLMVFFSPINVNTNISPFFHEYKLLALTSITLMNIFGKAPADDYPVQFSYMIVATFVD